MKKVLSLILSLALILSLGSVMAFAEELEKGEAEQTEELVELLAENPPAGYTVSESGQMAYRLGVYGNRIDIQGVFDGKWKKTTYDDGFLTSAKIDGTTYAVVNDGSDYSLGSTLVSVAVSADFVNNGRAVQITHTVTNSSAADVTFSLGSYADVKIGADDSATVTSVGNKGFKMISDKIEDKSAAGEYAQFTFICRDDPKVTDVTDFWYGNYRGGIWSSNSRNPAHAFILEDPSVTSFEGDSVMSWSWQNQTLAAGETKAYSVVMRIQGSLGLDDVVDGDNVNSSPNFDFWYAQSSKLRDIKEGETLKVDARGVDARMPALTADLLRGRDVKVEITYPGASYNKTNTFTLGGKDIPAREANRYYYEYTELGAPLPEAEASK